MAIVLWGVITMIFYIATIGILAKALWGITCSSTDFMSSHAAALNLEIDQNGIPDGRLKATCGRYKLLWTMSWALAGLSAFNSPLFWMLTNTMVLLGEL